MTCTVTKNTSKTQVKYRRIIRFLSGVDLIYITLFGIVCVCVCSTAYLELLHIPSGFHSEISRGSWPVSSQESLRCSLGVWLAIKLKTSCGQSRGLQKKTVCKYRAKQIELII